MCDCEKRIVELEKQVAELTANKRRADYAWSKVLAEAKNFARMKTFCQYVESRGDKEILTSVSLSDQEMYLKHFVANMQQYAVHALSQEIS